MRERVRYAGHGIIINVSDDNGITSEISPTQLNILPSTHTGQRSRQVVISTTRRNHTSSRVNCPTLKRGGTTRTYLQMYKPIYCHSTHIILHSYGYLAAIIFRCSLSLSISFLT